MKKILGAKTNQTKLSMENHCPFSYFEYHCTQKRYKNEYTQD